MHSKTDLTSQYTSKDFDTYFHSDRTEMLSYIPHEAQMILEVGCGSGNFGQLLKEKYSANVWGIELNEKAATVAMRKLDRVICAAFDSRLDLPTQKFDCIVFNDVLEHLVDPFTALTYSKELLRPEGVIVASIPNVRYFENIWKLVVDKDWKYTDWGILDRTHLRFFTQKSITSMFDSLDYDIEVIEGINPLERESPHYLRKFNFMNSLLFNQIADMRYLQFAVVASPKH